MNLIGTNIFLRALEPEDLDYLYRTENDPAFALFGDQHPPYSRNLLKAYIDQAHQSIFILDFFFEFAFNCKIMIMDRNVLPETPIATCS